MAQDLLPLVVEPAELEMNLGKEQLLIVDLSRPETYFQTHVPGAVHIDYPQIVAAHPPGHGTVAGRRPLERCA